MKFKNQRYNEIKLLIFTGFIVCFSIFVNSNDLSKVINLAENILGEVAFFEKTAVNVSLSFLDDLPDEFCSNNQFSSPLDDAIITSNFGSRVHPVTKVKSFHSGVDLDSLVCDNVYAIADGKITAQGFDDINGNYIEITHQNGYISLYTHLSEFTHKTNILAGEIIGKMGDTGTTTGAHLHIELRKDGKLIDPLSEIILYEN